MKNISHLVMTLIISVQVFAQDPDPRIFTTWYITEYIDEGVITYFPPEGYPITFVDEGNGDCPYFFDFPNHISSGQDCIENLTNEQFAIHSLGVLAEGELCLDGSFACLEFFDKYYSFYTFLIGTGEASHFYEIQENSNGTKTLVVTNAIFSVAIYSNVNLSVDEFLKTRVVVFPSPAKDILHIDSEVQIDNIQIYSIQGQLINETSNTEIDVSGLSAGLYFANLSVDGQTITKRFVKS